MHNNEIMHANYYGRPQSTDSHGNRCERVFVALAEGGRALADGKMPY
jgi:hypothetical protein